MTVPEHPDTGASAERVARLERIARDAHAQCASVIKDGMTRLGCDVTVSTLPPIVTSPYEDLGLICPHGVRFYAEPTSEQIATVGQGRCAVSTDD